MTILLEILMLILIPSIGRETITCENILRWQRGVVVQISTVCEDPPNKDSCLENNETN